MTLVTDDRVQAYLEMVLVRPNGNETPSGIVVVQENKDEIKEGVVTEVGPEVPTLEVGDLVFYATEYVLPGEIDVAVHFSDIVAYKRLYADPDA